MAVLVAPATIAETNDTSNVTTHASGSFTPVANRLYLLAVSHSDTAPEATVPTIATTTGLTFVQVGSSLAYDTIASNVHRLTLFRAMKSAGLSTGTYTVTLADADTGAASVLIEVTQVVTTGSDGADAVINVSTNVADAGANPSITMGAFSDNNNGVAAFFGFDVTAAATAANTGWAVVGDASYATPNTGVTALWRGANAATAVCTHTSADWAGIAVELVSEAVPTIRPVQPPDPPKRKAALAAAILAGACFFSPLPIPFVPTADAVAGGSDGQITACRQIQYAAVAGPVVVPAVQTPTTPDLTAASPPDRIARVRTGPRSETWAPLFVPDVTQAAPALSWKPTYPDRIVRPAVHPSRSPFTAADRFDPPTNLPATALSWQRIQPDAVVRKKRLTDAPQAVAQLYVPDVTQPVTARSWAPLYPDRLTPPKGTRAPYQLAFVCDLTTPAPVVDTETGTTGADSGVLGRAGLVQYQALAGPVVVPGAAPAAPTFAQAVSPHRLSLPYPRALYVWAQPMFGVETDVPVEAWAAIYPDRIARRASATSAVVVSDPTTPAVAAVPPQPLTSYPERVGRPRTHASAAPAWAAPSFVPDVTQPVTALSWEGSQPDRVPGRLSLHAGRQLAFAFDRFDAPGAVVVPDLSWQRIQPDAVVRAKRLTDAPQAVSPAFVPDVTQPAPALAWEATYPDRIGRVRVAPERAPAFAFDRFDAPGTITTPDLVAAVYPAFVARRSLARLPIETRCDQPAAVATPELVPAVYPDTVARRTLHPSRLPFDARDKFDAPTPPVVTPLSWKAIYPDRVDRLPTRGPALLPFRAELSPTAHLQATQYINGRPLAVPHRVVLAVPERARLQVPRRRTCAPPDRVVCQVGRRRPPS